MEYIYVHPVLCQVLCLWRNSTTGLGAGARVVRRCRKSKVSDVDLSMSLLRVQVLSQSVKKENSLQFHFRVRFYPENVEEELIQDVTRVSTRWYARWWIYLSIALRDQQTQTRSSALIDRRTAVVHNLLMSLYGAALTIALRITTSATCFAVTFCV